MNLHKVVVLFTLPANPAKFEERWTGEFVPLAEQMPGVRRIAVSRVQGSPGGPSPFYLVHEFFFDSLDAARAALASSEGAAAGRALLDIAPEGVFLFFADHMDEERKG